MKLKEITGNLAIYFNWSCNALMPINSGAADIYLVRNKYVIEKTARELLQSIGYTPQKLYRGIILREPATAIQPDNRYQYISFTTDIKVAEHFADVNGFGSNLVNVAEQLGEYGYVIEYTPTPEEILFHYKLFELLPYAEAFELIGIDGKGEVDSLMKQKEIMIRQPGKPLTNIKPFKIVNNHFNH